MKSKFSKLLCIFIIVPLFNCIKSKDDIGSNFYSSIFIGCFSDTLDFGKIFDNDTCGDFFGYSVEEKVGAIENGNFVENTSITLIDNASSIFDINLALASRLWVVFQLTFQDNEFITNITSFDASVWTEHPIGTMIDEPVVLKFYKIGNSLTFRTFDYNETSQIGKRIVFVSPDTPDDVIGEKDHVYVIKGKLGAKIIYHVSTKQFL